MILQSLAAYYEQLQREHPDKIARPGWCSRQVAFILDLSSEGELRNIIPAEEKRGWTKMVPDQLKRTVGIAPNLLCDNASYMLGIDAKGKPERAFKCFEAARERHLEVLSPVDSLAAQAVCAFFQTWNPVKAELNQAVQNAGDALMAGGNLVFSVNSCEVLEDVDIKAALEELLTQPSEDSVQMTCLVTGERAPIARLHPAIKGVYGAQAMGASLVGFNARAFESYGHDEEQGLNAPVSERATFAYTTALNYLLAQREHHIRLGDTTIVYWADRHDDVCSCMFSDAVNPFTMAATEQEDPDKKIDAVMHALSEGKKSGDTTLESTFYVLGLAPNAARLSVRFFLRNTFGEMLENLERHYDRLDIVHSPWERKFLSPYQLLKETENPNAKQPVATSILSGSLMQSILTDSRYPESLYENVLLRVRASQDNDERHTKKVTRGRAAITKAYLLKNKGGEKEATAMKTTLDETRGDAPYVLGRLFSVLEAVQAEANPGINSTIKNRYFNSACSTPATVFPVLIKLGQTHLNKLARGNKGLAVFYEKQVQELCAALSAFPKRLSLTDQGVFILGYYYQTQKRYEKNDQTSKQDQEA